MKKLFALALALAAPCLLSAAQKPDGVLGTSLFSFEALYQNSDYGYYDDGDFDFVGFGVKFNHKLTSFGNIGMDLYMSTSYMTNQNETDQYQLDSQDGFIGLTFHRDGMVAPFFRPVIGYAKETVELSTGAELSWDSFLYGATFGAEVHLLPGFSATPFVEYLCASDNDARSITRVGLSLNYWITERLGASTSLTYCNSEHVDTTNISAGMSLRF